MKSLAFSVDISKNDMGYSKLERCLSVFKTTMIKTLRPVLPEWIYRKLLFPLTLNRRVLWRPTLSVTPSTRIVESTQPSNMEIRLSEKEITETLKSIVQTKFNVDVTDITVTKHRFGETEYNNYGAISLVFSVKPKGGNASPSTHPDESTRRMDPSL
jgi:hypothetical protein